MSSNKLNELVKSSEHIERPRIKRTIESIAAPNGDIFLMRPSADEDIVITKPKAAQRGLLEALTGEHTMDDLQDRFGMTLVDATVADLAEVGALEDASDDELIPLAERARFDRQLRYFSDVGGGGLTPSECQRRLREAKVAILGVGGLGGATARSLASIGVGELWLVDGDRIEASNLNRQTLYAEAEVGLLKVEMAAARLRAFYPQIRISTTAKRLESEQQIADFIVGSNVVVGAADWPAHDIERWCNAACFSAGIPYLTMSHFPPVARVGPFFVPGTTGCFECQMTSYRQEYPLLDLAVERRRAQPIPAATLGPACELIGGHAGLDVMHLLTGLASPSTLGSAHICDLRTMEVRRESVVRNPGCSVCGSSARKQQPL